jgi:hypothetical protein
MTKELELLISSQMQLQDKLAQQQSSAEQLKFAVNELQLLGKQEEIRLSSLLNERRKVLSQTKQEEFTLRRTWDQSLMQQISIDGDEAAELAEKEALERELASSKPRLKKAQAWQEDLLEQLRLLGHLEDLHLDQKGISTRPHGRPRANTPPDLRPMIGKNLGKARPKSMTSFPVDEIGHEHAEAPVRPGTPPPLVHSITPPLDKGSPGELQSQSPPSASNKFRTAGKTVILSARLAGPSTKSRRSSLLDAPSAMPKLVGTPSAYQPTAKDAVDMKLGAWQFHDFDPSDIIRIKEGLYKIHGGEYTIKLLSGYLVVRVGGSYVNFSTFLLRFKHSK